MGVHAPAKVYSMPVFSVNAALISVIGFFKKSEVPVAAGAVLPSAVADGWAVHPAVLPGTARVRIMVIGATIFMDSEGYLPGAGGRPLTCRKGASSCPWSAEPVV